MATLALAFSSSSLSPPRPSHAPPFPPPLNAQLPPSYRSSHFFCGTYQGIFLPFSVSSLRRSSSSSSSSVRLVSRKASTAVAESSIFDFTVKDIDKKDVDLSKYRGKVLLVVNVASRCGYTASNYTDLAKLYKKLKGQDFEVLAFPCNQFGGQEPGTNQQIKEFACSRFKAEYPIFDKVDVNGFNTAPVYKFLKSNKSSGLFGNDNIKWNFTKFLLDKNGQVVQRYESGVSPLQIEKDIRKLLES